MITNNLNSHYAHIMNNKKNINSIKTQQTSIKNKINESVCICKYYDNDLFNFTVDSNDNYYPIKIINNHSVIFNNNLYQTITCAIIDEVSSSEEEPETQRYFTIIKRISSNYDESIIFYNKTQKIIIYNMILYSNKLFVIYSISNNGVNQINKFGYIQLSNSSIPNTINEISVSQYYPTSINLNKNKYLNSKKLRNKPYFEPFINPITNFCLITKLINNTIRNIIYIPINGTEYLLMYDIDENTITRQIWYYTQNKLQKKSSRSTRLLNNNEPINPPSEILQMFPYKNQYIIMNNKDNIFKYDTINNRLHILPKSGIMTIDKYNLYFYNYIEQNPNIEQSFGQSIIYKYDLTNFEKSTEDEIIMYIIEDQTFDSIADICVYGDNLCIISNHNISENNSEQPTEINKLEDRVIMLSISLGTEDNSNEYKSYNLTPTYICDEQSFNIQQILQWNNKLIQNNYNIQKYSDYDGFYYTCIYENIKNVLNFTANSIYLNGAVYIPNLALPEISETNQTITHNAPIMNNIESYTIGSPVFLSNRHKTFKLKKIKIFNNIPVYKYIEITKNNYLENTTNQIPLVSNETSNNFIGIITKINKNGSVYTLNNDLNSKIIILNNTIDFATHGDYIFRTQNNIEHNTTSGGLRNYKIGDELLYDGTIIDDNTPITNKILKKSIGVITYIPEHNTEYVSVFKK